jgi:lipopolysaccharide biosynthesis protein
MTAPNATWVIYAAFSPDGQPTPYAAEQVASYRELGFNTLVVDTSPHLSNARRAAWDRLATHWFQRANVGYDFTSYREGIEHLRATNAIEPGATAVLLTNDSCFGPFEQMHDVFVRIRRDGGPAKTVYAITDSYEFHHHLQSYWLYVPPDVLAVALEFFDEMRPLSGLDDAISFGELAFSRFLSERGCTLRALAPTAEVVPRFARFNGFALSLLEFGFRRLLRRPKYSRATDAACLRHLLHRPSPFEGFNPTLGLGIRMVEAGLTPFVKRRLLRENPYADPSIPPCPSQADLQNRDVLRLLRSVDARGQGNGG